MGEVPCEEEVIHRFARRQMIYAQFVLC